MARTDRRAWECICCRATQSEAAFYSQKMGRRYLTVVALLLVGCASSAPSLQSDLASASSDLASTSSAAPEPEDQEDNAGVSGETLEDLDLVDGAATAFRLVSLEEADDYQNLDAGSAGEVDLVGCRWRGPGLYSFDMTWAPDEPVDWPVTILVEQRILRGDEGFRWGGFVTLSGPGDFSVPHNTYEVARLLDEQREKTTYVSANRSDLRAEQSRICYPGGSDLHAQVAVVVDLIEETQSGAPGTVEELVNQIDVLDDSSPYMPLAAFAPQAEQFGIDRLFVAPGGSLVSITAELGGGCVSVRSNYVIDGEPQGQLLQTLGCPVETSSELDGAIAIADEVWTVTVTGPAGTVEAFAAGVQARPFTGVRLLEAVDDLFDATAALAAKIRESEFIEIIRVPWDDGLIAIGFHNYEFSVERYADPIVAVPVRFGGGGGGVGCQDFATLDLGDSTRGFVFVVVEDASHDVVLLDDGERRVLEAIPAVGDRAVVFFDKAEQPGIRMESLSVIDANGASVPCVQ